jgi:hypothetical protein
LLKDGGIFWFIKVFKVFFGLCSIAMVIRNIQTVNTDNFFILTNIGERRVDFLFFVHTGVLSAIRKRLFSLSFAV